MLYYRAKGRVQVRVAPTIVLTDPERAQLQRLVRSRRTQRATAVCSTTLELIIEKLGHAMKGQYAASTHYGAGNRPADAGFPRHPR